MNTKNIKFIDLFCGLGGFRTAVEKLRQDGECVFSCDFDADSQKSYEANFGKKPFGDITKIHENYIPEHDILLAGFPCQAFSICGDQKGFEDTRGTLFFDIARILQAKQPKAFVLENVKQLVSHNHGKTFHRIIETLENLGFQVHYKILNALDFGLPQKRERVFIVGFREPRSFVWQLNKIPMKPLREVLEKKVAENYFASEKIKGNRLRSVENKIINDDLTIWHENKGGNISPLRYSCALRSGASYNYLLVNGERRLTEREMLRLQGFPESYKIVVGYQAMRKLAGNSVAIPCVEAVLRSVFEALEKPTQAQIIKPKAAIQESLFTQI
ncbi:MAG: DNA cytosine methyltransferase [Pyrinomonadaceae bacterium]